MFSLVVPFLNRAELLPRMLESLDRCLLKPRVTIFVNNGSTDESEAVIRAFFRKRPELPFLLVNEEKPGAAAARNAGLQRVETEWVYFFDSDDELSPDYFTAVTEAAVRQPETDLIACPTTLRFSNGKEKQRVTSFTNSVANQIIMQSLNTQSMFLRTDFLRRIGGWDERAMIWNDWELGIRALHRGARIQWLRRPFHYIHLHPESITGPSFSLRLERILQTLAIVKEELSDSPRELEALRGRIAVVAGTLRREGNTEGARRMLDFAQTANGKPLPLPLLIIYRMTAAGIPGMWRALKAICR